MNAVILAAGKGERLQPLTSWLPKQLVPVLGRAMAEWPLRLALASCDRVAFVVRASAYDLTHAWLGSILSDLDRSRVIVTIMDQLGERQAIQAGVDMLGCHGDDHVFVAFCDNVCRGLVVTAPSVGRSCLYVADAEKLQAFAGRYGMVSDGQVLPKGSVGTGIQTGLMVLALDEVKKTNWTELVDLLAWCARDERLDLEPAGEFWIDVGEYDAMEFFVNAGEAGTC